MRSILLLFLSVLFFSCNTNSENSDVATEKNTGNFEQISDAVFETRDEIVLFADSTIMNHVRNPKTFNTDSCTVLTFSNQADRNQILFYNLNSGKLIGKETIDKDKFTDRVTDFEITGDSLFVFDEYNIFVFRISDMEHLKTIPFPKDKVPNMPMDITSRFILHHGKVIYPYFLPGQNNFNPVVSFDLSTEQVTEIDCPLPKAYSDNIWAATFGERVYLTQSTSGKHLFISFLASSKVYKVDVATLKPVSIYHTKTEVLDTLISPFESMEEAFNMTSEQLRNFMAENGIFGCVSDIPGTNKYIRYFSLPSADREQKRQGSYAVVYEEGFRNPKVYACNKTGGAPRLSANEKLYFSDLEKTLANEDSIFLINVKPKVR